MDWKANLEKILQGKHLETQEAEEMFTSVMEGKVSEIQLAAFLTALKAKGESTREILGACFAMRKMSKKPPHFPNSPILDTCGTGGDGKGTLNVSTLSGLVLASLGAKVAKHGNRSVSSHSGSSDILQSIGYTFPANPETAVQEIEEKGFVFLFAPDWHPAMRFAGPVRKELGFRTIFNILGPLTNPLRPTHQVVGFYQVELLDTLEPGLSELGWKRGILCHSRDGLDEFSIFAPTDYRLWDGNQVHRDSFEPSSLPLQNKPDPNQVFVQTAEEAGIRFREVLHGSKDSGSDLVSLNAGVGLFVLGEVSSIRDGFLRAQEALHSKKVAQYARETLNCREA